MKSALRMVLAASTLAMISWSAPAGAQGGAAGDRPLGSLHDVAAWVNRMPLGGGSRLHVIGTITAPTPCYDAVAVLSGEKPGTPPTPQVEVTIAAEDGMCVQVPWDIEFHFTMDNFTGASRQVEVHTATDSATVAIEQVF